MQFYSTFVHPCKLILLFNICMKKILIVVFLAFVSVSVEAQQLVWNNKLENAIEQSSKSKKPLLLFFTGSDWCGWCKRLQSEVFTKPEFVTWAKDNVILVEVDFPRKTALPQDLQTQNNQLQQFFEVAGYPTIWFVNPGKLDGKISFEKLGSTGYVAGGPLEWLKVANGILKRS